MADSFHIPDASASGSNVGHVVNSSQAGSWSMADLLAKPMNDTVGVLQRYSAGRVDPYTDVVGQASCSWFRLGTLGRRRIDEALSSFPAISSLGDVLYSAHVESCIWASVFILSLGDIARRRQRQRMLLLDSSLQNGRFNVKQFPSSFRRDARPLKQQRPWPKENFKGAFNSYHTWGPKRTVDVPCLIRPFDESHRNPGNYTRPLTQLPTALEPQFPSARIDQSNTRDFNAPGNLDRSTSSSTVEVVQPGSKASSKPVPTVSTFSQHRRSRAIAEGNGSIRMHSADTQTQIAILQNRLQRGIITDSYAYIRVLQMCLKQKDLLAAKQVHYCIMQSGMDQNPHVANTLLNVYVKCGALFDARQVFDDLEKKSVMTWNMMIAGYARSNDAESALEIFKLMRQDGAQPNEVTFLCILKACTSPLALTLGKQVHECIRDSGFKSDVRVGTALLQMYAKCGCITEARRVFEDLTNRDVMTWNIMIGAHADCGCGVEAYELFLQMRREGFHADAFTYSSLLNARASAEALEWMKEVHGHARKAGLESHMRVGTALVRFYAESGRIDDARLVFDRMEKRDVITWNIMIGAYAAECGPGEEAYRLFCQMRRDGFAPDAFTYSSILNASASAGALEWVKEIHDHARQAGLDSDLRVGAALLRMYAKSGSIDDARLLFDSMEKRDVIIWTAMLGGLAQHGCGQEAYRLFLQMRRDGFEPDGFTYASILNPSASAGALEWVKDVHGHASKAGLESDLRVGTALVHMYAESGSIDDARLVFDRMEKRDVVTWTAMIGGLAHHGHGHDALALFRKMKGDLVKPNGTTFVAVLSACCHGGLVDDGRRLFSAMTRDCGIEPTVVHYNCMVDLLGRAGHLEEAKLFIRDMPIKANEVTWTALLGACRTYGNVELGELAAKQLLKLEPNNASAYVLLSNIYASAGKWEKKSLVRTLMQERGVRKEPGRSWIDVDDKIHDFVVGDTSHPEANAIYTELNKLTEKLKAAGYIPDTQLVLQNMDENEKEVALCSHSEKLAITYGLMRMPPGKPIRVYKNLRVCSDCHTATKLISKVTGREIIARDANRFHHFKDGVCSCGDYW